MILRASAEPPQTFYSRASVTRAGAPSARSLLSQSRTQSAPPPHLPKPQTRRVQSLSREGQSSDRLVPEAPHRPSIPVGCHQVLPDGRIALGVPAQPQPSNHLPVVSDAPFCSDCDSHIVGVFVRIKDKNLHVECFKCSTCGSSLKNQGYYNLNGKLYCDIHAKLVARQNPPAPNLEPVTVAPGGRIPTNPYTTPLPPLSTGNYTNGSSSLFSPGSNLSGPKPFGSSIGSAYSPSLSPRSAPMSPARPVVAPAHTPAPAAPLSAPFAPNKNVKSIVWPPPNPPEDDTPLQTSSEYAPSNPTGDPASITTGTLLKKATESKVEKDQIVSGDQFISTSQENAFSSSVSFSSASMSTAIADSSFTKSSIQSEESQVAKEFSSCTVQSFSEQASSEGRTYMAYQTQPSEFQSIGTNETKLMEKSMHETKGYSSNEKSTIKAFPSTLDAAHSSNSYSYETQPQISQNRGQFNYNNTETQNTLTNLSDNISHTKPQNISTPSHGNQGKGGSLQSTGNSSKVSQKDTISQSFQTSKPGQVKPSMSRPTNKKTKTPTSTSEKKSDISPMVAALTTMPDRPFTPVSNICKVDNTLLNDTDVTSSLSMCDSYSRDFHSMSSQQLIPQSVLNEFETKDIERFNTSTNNTCNNLQTSSQVSAFRPVGQYSSQQLNFTSVNDSSINTQSMSSNSQSATTCASSSSTHTTQSYFEQLDQKQTSLSTTVSSKLSTLPGDIPVNKTKIINKPQFQQDLPSSPNAFGVSQETFIPVVNPANRNTSQQNDSPTIVAPAPLHPLKREQDIKMSVSESPQTLKSKITPISMVSQPVSDENTIRTSPPRSRPSTPSLINKPAPIIPRYQMNLVTMEHYAPESHTYQPPGGEGSRTPTPKPRSRTPAQGPSSKAQAPRIKDYSQSNFGQSETFSHQLPSTFQRDLYPVQTQPAYYENRPPLVQEENRSNFERQSESYNKGDMSVKQDTMMNQNYGQRQMESQNVAEYGHTTVQTTRKTFEEYESAQTAKMIEIKKGGFASSDSYQPIEAFDRPSAINFKQTLPSPAMSFSPSTQNFSSNITNENVDTTRQTHTSTFEMSPSISGANRGPVCDPTPSTGSSVGAAARGKTFGVSSAPKRGRGVLNKAVLPGSRVPLCGSCNGNVRGPFITALGRIWCPEHFICVNATCRRPLQDIGFVEENGQLYCEFCFEQYIAPACDKCHAKIKEDCLNAIGKHFHPECFSCVYCGKLFGNNPFFLEDGLPYCEADWNELFTTKCFACGFPVEAGDRWVEALNNNYHSQCFNCTVCKKNLEGQSFFARGGRPFCRVHAR
ncbi:unnamed protein product [Pieris macdunnoughi]|uniref:LIM zinc-binding domain-containing protein n=1 Tax=Pieris macdunnoughi TaxID=345717 RepID=A0A821MYZ9_9NEOP|nr:unnamed protein product [Pieris macdunnoughi]